MVGAIARGAQSIHSKIFKVVQRKGYHRESSQMESKSVAVSTNGEGIDTHGSHVDGCDVIWVPDPRTGIYYPKGQEKVMEDIPTGAARTAAEVHWFSYSSDGQNHLFQ